KGFGSRGTLQRRADGAGACRFAPPVTDWPRAAGASFSASRPPAAGADAGARGLARRRVGRLRAAHRRGRRVPPAALARSLVRRAARAADPWRARRRAPLLARRLDDPLPLAPLRKGEAVAPSARRR